MDNQKGFKISQYACAVLLIVSSIALVAYQVVEIDDVAGGLLYYVAQSFLLAGSTSPGIPSPRPVTMSALVITPEQMKGGSSDITKEPSLRYNKEVQRSI